MEFRYPPCLRGDNSLPAAYEVHNPRRGCVGRTNPRWNAIHHHCGADAEAIWSMSMCSLIGLVDLARQTVIALFEISKHGRE